MPEIKTWNVKAPDGTVVSFKAPDSMQPEDVIARAQQEYAFQKGKIPTTFGQGVRQSIGETVADNSGRIGTAIGLAGTLAGQPEVIAASPAIGRATQAVGEAIAGRPIKPVNMSDVAMLAAEGAVEGYGAQAATNALRGFSKAAPSIRGHGFWPFAIKNAGPAASATADAVEQVTPTAIGAAVKQDVKAIGDTVARVKAGVSAEDLQLMKDNIANGMAPSTAAKIISGGNPGYMSKLMTLYMRSRMRP